MKRFLTITMLALAGVTTAASSASAGVLPVGSSAFGSSYSEWSAAWWQWGLGTPESENSLLDTTGEHCAAGQSGSVWFLAGSLVGEVERTCTIPAGKALFFPVLNQAIFNFPGDPFDEEAERARVASCFGDFTAYAVIDGVEVSNLEDQYVESVLFSVSMPESDALFGLDGVELSPAVDAGIYILYTPISPGLHQIEFGGVDACGNAQSIAYTITVA